MRVNFSTALQANYAQPRYKHHRVVDDQCGVVTAMVTTPGERQGTVPLVRQGRTRGQTLSPSPGRTDNAADSRAGISRDKQGLSPNVSWRPVDIAGPGRAGICPSPVPPLGDSP